MDTISQKIKKYELKWRKKCYKDGIPDEVPNRINHLNLAPSWKKIALCILNNDMHLTGIGYSAKQSKFYHLIKRDEIEKRKGLKKLF